MNSHPLYLNLERHKHQTNIKRIGLYILFSVAGQILLILHHINKNLPILNFKIRIKLKMKTTLNKKNNKQKPKKQDIKKTKLYF